jgi:phosphoribosyl-AMP cyclohydrolase
MNSWLDEVRFDERGLVAVVAQDAATDRILMVAWADRDALAETVAGGEAVYWSRSRGRRWRKGEESGHTQRVSEVRLDCDGDTVLYRVEPAGGVSCHTGRASCFFRRLEGVSDAARWQVTDPVLDPAPDGAPAHVP